MQYTKSVFTIATVPNDCGSCVLTCEMIANNPLHHTVIVIHHIWSGI
jgi:hypothetical protein